MAAGCIEGVKRAGALDDGPNGFMTIGDRQRIERAGQDAKASAVRVLPAGLLWGSCRADLPPSMIELARVALSRC